MAACRYTDMNRELNLRFTSVYLYFLSVICTSIVSQIKTELLALSDATNFFRFDAGENGIPFEMNFESAFDVDVIGFSAFAFGFVNSDVLLSASVYKSLECSCLRTNFNVVEAGFLGSVRFLVEQFEKRNISAEERLHRRLKLDDCHASARNNRFMQDAFATKKAADSIELPVTAAFVAKMIGCGIDNRMFHFPNVEFIEQWPCHRIKSFDGRKPEAFSCVNLLSFHLNSGCVKRTKKIPAGILPWIARPSRIP